MNKFKRAVAMLLMLCMVLSLAPATVFAAPGESAAEPMDLTGNSVTLELWITNAKVTANNANSVSISRNRAGIQTADGVALDTIAPASGRQGSTEVLYWKSVRLDSSNKQTTGGGDDKTADGTQMTHIRYMNSRWEYKTTAGEWRAFATGDQLVAYYMQPIDVTDQIITLSKDWGYDPADNSDTPDDGQVALSFAVVDGSTLTPAEKDIHAESTMIFNYWRNRDIGVVSPVNNSNYEIYKITVTEGVRSANTSSNNWGVKDKTNWYKTEINLGKDENGDDLVAYWYDEREVWNISEGTVPEANGQLDNIVWQKKNTAFLLLFYVRAKNANLNVRYVDDSLDGALITERGIFADAEGTFFTELEQRSSVPSQGGYFTLDDDATLTYRNSETGRDVVQTFEKSLLHFQDIAPQYRSGAYQYVGAELSDDGLTLTLHYNIDETKLNPKYVVDFGLSVDVPLSDVIENYKDASKVEVLSAAYGTASISGSTLTYTPNKVLLSPAAVPVKVTYSNNSTAVLRVGFIPASTVNYEEGFAAFSNATLSGDEDGNPVWGSDQTHGWRSVGSTGSGKQSLQTTNDANGNYGYDAKYAKETGMTNGTQAISTASGDKAELTFTGTGIDVYANCDKTTSTVAVLLYREDGSMVKMYQVDTSAVAGTTTATDGQGVTSYNLPIVSFQGLTFGTYKIVIQHTKPADNTAEFRLDGFRVYNPVTDVSEYAADENAPTFLELRNAVLAAEGITEASNSDPYNWSGALIDQVYNNEGTLAGVVYLGGLDNEQTQDLLENGPKNELFLFPGDAVTFTVNGTAQIGLKALNGEANYTVNGTAYSVSTSADMFYHEGATGEISIVNTGTTVLSLTKLKLFGELAQVTSAQVVATLSLMGAEIEGEVEELPVIPEVETVYDDAVVNVDVVDYKGRTVAQVALTANGVQGQPHTFTAAEIVAAVKAQLPEAYALVDETRVSDVRVDFGKTAPVKVQAGMTAVVTITYVDRRTGAVAGEAEIVSVQTSDRSWVQITAADIRNNAPAGRTAVEVQPLKASYGYSYSLVVAVI